MTRPWGRILAGTLVTALLLVVPRPVSTQTLRGLSRPSASPLVQEGDRLHESLKPAEALAAYRRALEEDPESYGALWRAAREAVSLGMLATDDETKKERYRQAEAFGRKAVEVTPDDAAGHHWLSVALGRLALTEGLRTRLRLATEVRSEALRVLELDSLHAGGHHVLGQWHAEVKRLSGVSRFFAQHVLNGEGLDEASWDQAVSHLERATALSPETLIHHLELARVYLDRNQEQEARQELREVLERPALEPTDPLHKQEAVRLMRELS